MLLVKFGTNVDIRNRNGQTALHRLLVRLTPDNQKATFALIVELLQHGGADPNAKDNEGESVLQVLINRLDSKNVYETISKAVKLLVMTTGTNVNIYVRNGQTPAHRVLRRLNRHNQKASSALIIELLKHGCDPSAVGTLYGLGGCTALSGIMSKLYECDLELMLALVAKLLDHGVNPLATEETGELVLESLYHSLLRSRHKPDAALALLNRLVDGAIEQRGEKDRKTLATYQYMATWLQMLTRRLNKNNREAASELIHTLLQHGVDLTMVQDVDKYKRTSLHHMTDWLDLVGYGLSENDPDIGVAMVNQLLRLGVDPNAQDYRGATVLHYITGIVEIRPQNLHLTMRIVNTLFEHGMDLNTQDDSGRTALHSITDNILDEAAITLVTWLLDHGIDPHVQDSQGRTALHDLVDASFKRSTLNPAVWDNQDMALISLVNTLLEHGLDPNKQDYGGSTALHCMMAADATPATVTALLKGGADPRLLNRYGETPLHILVAGSTHYGGNTRKTAAIATCLFEHQDRLGQRPPSSFLVVWNGELRLVTIEEDTDPTRMQRNAEMTS